MREEDKEFLFGAVLCPSCEFGIITKGHVNAHGYRYESGSGRLGLDMYMTCPYCGETIICSDDGREVAYNITITGNNECRFKEITIVDP